RDKLVFEGGCALEQGSHHGGSTVSSTRNVDRLGKGRQGSSHECTHTTRSPAHGAAESAQYADRSADSDRHRGRHHCRTPHGRGGRLFYVGAGTSGRLGVLDAAEMPPTYGTNPEMVQGIIAGGYDALVRAQEGAEDRREDGARDLAARGVTSDDFVLGIATSG